ncbi:glycosyltransferase family 4 protein [Sesbania bispinosa]|nr:glycosyltransferase family 4 protein [Sesbania bispinosa]
MKNQGKKKIKPSLPVEDERSLPEEGQTTQRSFFLCLLDVAKVVVASCVGDEATIRDRTKKQ